MKVLTRTLRAIPTLFRVGVTTSIAYRGELVMWVFASNTPLVMLVLWRAVADEGPIAGFGAKQFTAYFLLSLVVRLLTGSWAVYELNNEIRRGTIAMRILRPIHPFVSYAADNLGGIPIRLLVALPIAALALCNGGARQFASDPWLWVMGAVAIGGAWLLSFCVMLAIGSMGLLLESSLAIWDVWFGLFVTFSGYLMPLALLPPWLNQMLRVSPFPYAFALPVEVVLGLHTRTEALRGLAIQCAYSMTFLAAAVAIWRRGLVRFAAYGG